MEEVGTKFSFISSILGEIFGIYIAFWSAVFYIFKQFLDLIKNILYVLVTIYFEFFKMLKYVY